MVVKLNKSLYRQVQAPLYCYNNMNGDFEARGFKPILLDPWMFYERVIITLIYVDDDLLFDTNQDKIYEVIKEI